MARLLLKIVVHILLYSIFILSIFCLNPKPCQKRKNFDQSVVCVCNALYCDEIPSLPENLTENQYTHYVTSKDDYRLEQQIMNFIPGNDLKIDIVLNHSQTFQKIMGFGGAVTDSAALNLKYLSSDVQETFLNAYFGENSIQYSIIRVPIGGSDFSTREYTYDDYGNDVDLIHFELAKEDINLKIPFLKAAENKSTTPLKIIAAPWTAPAWMKQNKRYKGGSQLRREYYQVWANYLLKFLQEYSKLGVNIWALSIQNEPISSSYFYFYINGMKWHGSDQAEFLLDNLLPILRSNGFDNLDIIVGDDHTPLIEKFLKNFNQYSTALQNISGVATHWYFDSVTPKSTFEKIQKMIPNKYILCTEASILKVTLPIPMFQLWKYGELYASNIIQNLVKGAHGWLDWNMALDMQGGPNVYKAYLESAIMINKNANEFVKQPAYYIIGHFSKFIPPGSVRFQLNETHKIHSSMIGFITPKQQTVIVIMNRSFFQEHLVLYDPKNDKYISVDVPKRSIHTIIY